MLLCCCVLCAVVCCCCTILVDPVCDSADECDEAECGEDDTETRHGGGREEEEEEEEMGESTDKEGAGTWVQEMHICIR